MSFPAYDSDEKMSAKLLIALRLCGEIDADGGGYGDEEEDEDENNDEDGADEIRSDDESIRRVNWSLREDDNSDNSESDNNSYGGESGEHEMDEED